MKPIRALMFMATLCLAGIAHAQDADDVDPKFFKDFTGVSKLLRANGVEPAGIKWAFIETVCSPMNDRTDPTAYNRCRFEKARDQVFFRGDTRICRNESVAAYPDALLGNNPITAVRYKNGVATTTVVEQTPLSRSDVDAMRRASFEGCMDSKGWRDSRSYLMGRD